MGDPPADRAAAAGPPGVAGPSPIRLLLCEDQTLMRQGLRTIRTLEPGFEVVAEAADGREAVLQAQRHRPDVVLMDVQMPELSGIEATAEIRRLAPASRIVILTTFDVDQYVIDGLRAGAAGYLLKDAPADELARTIRRVHAGESVIQPDVAARVLVDISRRSPAGAAVPADVLSERERDVLRLLAAGSTNRAIADRLSLTEGTVKNYVSSILDKLQASNRTQAVLAAKERRLI
jgi:DNA-binding NarL/FixJ family response regulator